jgi:hypothetical protein
MYALTPGAFKFHNYYFGRILLFPWMIIWNLIALAATILFAILKPILESILLIGYLILLLAAGLFALVGL